MQIRTALFPGVLPEIGPRNAFFDFRLEDGVLAWIGCGLGGGSLVNSGVCIAPDPRVFDLPAWPQEFKSDPKLKDGFTAAKAMLQPASYPDQGSNPLPRATRAQEASDTSWLLRPLCTIPGPLSTTYLCGSAFSRKDWCTSTPYHTPPLSRGTISCFFVVFLFFAGY